MIIPVDPPEQELVDDPNPCFAADETPFDLYLSFSGILTGTDYVPGVDPAPPNETFKLSLTVPSTWQLITPDVQTAIQLFIGISGVAFGFTVAGLVFASPGPQCARHFSNGIINPVGTKYYSGDCIIDWIPDVAGFSVESQAADFGLPLDGSMNFLSYPVAPTSRVLKFQTDDKVNKISILTDLS